MITSFTKVELLPIPYLIKKKFSIKKIFEHIKIVVKRNNTLKIIW